MMNMEMNHVWVLVCVLQPMVIALAERSCRLVLQRVKVPILTISDIHIGGLSSLLPLKRTSI